MRDTEVEANLREYLYGDSARSGRAPQERYSSFDYCFNYFQSFRDEGRSRELASPEHLQSSCLQLGFYLASWGMFRGSSRLLEKSARFLEPVIRAVASSPSDLWEIDANCYTPSNIAALLEFRRTLAAVWGPENAPTEILATKIMLGVFGNIPAFDTYFKKGFHVAVLGAKALGKVGSFYQSHPEIIERHRVPTLDFITGHVTSKLYTRAKVIDMIFFIEGAKLAQ